VHATRMKSTFCHLKAAYCITEVTANYIVVIYFLLLAPEALRKKLTPQVKVKVTP
jgi:hypothetical protein